MRVCLVTEFFYPDSSGSTPTLLSELMRYLKDHYSDLEIDVITSRHLYRQADQPLASLEDWNGIRIHRLATPRTNHPSTTVRAALGSLFSAAATLRLLFGPKHDLIFVGTNPPTAPMAAHILAKLRRTPYVYLIHDLYPDVPVSLGLFPKGGFVYRVSKAAQRTWLRSASKVIALGRCCREHIVSAYGLPGQKIEVITNWADPEQIKPMPKSSRFRSEHGLSGLIVLYAGNLGRAQGVDLILGAAKIVRDKRDDVTFVLAGQGSDRDEIAARIEKESISNARLFPAVSRDEYPDLLASADICLIPLAPNMDGLAVPCKFYGILASGRPIVAMVEAKSEIALTLRDHSCGVQVDRGSPRAVADAITGLLECPERLDQMGANARQAVEGSYNVANIAARYYELFRLAVGEPPPSC